MTPGSPTLDSTVVTPTYNRAQLIARAQDSLRQQAHWPARVIVVDDGSRDGTPEMAARWAREHNFPLTMDVLPRNGGPTVARNRGIELATTRYVAFLDSDDEQLPGALQHLAAALAMVTAEFSQDGLLLHFDCGTGSLLRHLRSIGHTRLHGLESSTRALRRMPGEVQRMLRPQESLPHLCIRQLSGSYRRAARARRTVAPLQAAAARSLQSHRALHRPLARAGRGEAALSAHDQRIPARPATAGTRSTALSRAVFVVSRDILAAFPGL